MPGHCQAGDVGATFNYALPNPSGKDLFHVKENPGSSKYEYNYIVNPRDVIVRDIRGRERDFSLESNGFEYLTRPTNESFTDRHSIVTNYYAEMQQLVQQHTGADRVFVISHKIRQSYATGDSRADGLGPDKKPIRSVHVDKTPEAVAFDVRKHMGDDAEQLLQGRVRFINIWRPIEHEVHHEPLGVVDWKTSSDESDLLPVVLEDIDTVPEVFLPRFRRTHAWYYLSHQTPSELTLVKCYDSLVEGQARFCLHSSFAHPGCYEGSPRRKSIEQYRPSDRIM